MDQHNTHDFYHKQRRTIGLIIQAATIDTGFRQLLLNQPRTAISDGYGNNTFEFDDDELGIFVALIEDCDSLEELTARLMMLSSNGRNGQG